MCLMDPALPVADIFFLFFSRDVVNTNTSNDSDKSDKTLVDVSILLACLKEPISLFLGNVFLKVNL